MLHRVGINLRADDALSRVEQLGVADHLEDFRTDPEGGLVGHLRAVQGAVEILLLHLAAFLVDFD